MSPRAFRARRPTTRRARARKNVPRFPRRGARIAGRKQKRRASRRTPRRGRRAPPRRAQDGRRRRSARAFFSVASSARSARDSEAERGARASSATVAGIRLERRALLLRAGQRLVRGVARGSGARDARRHGVLHGEERLAFGAVQERAVGGGGLDAPDGNLALLQEEEGVSPAGLAGDVAQLSTAFAGYPGKDLARTCSSSKVSTEPSGDAS